MIFQHTWAATLSGRKTQTRRLKKPGEKLRQIENAFGGYTTIGVTLNQRLKWAINHTYAVQPGRGQKTVGHIVITGVRAEDVRTISREDAWAEGFTSCAAFLRIWIGIHDMAATQRFDEYCQKNTEAEAISYLMARPAERYQAWVLRFEVVTK